MKAITLIDDRFSALELEWFNVKAESFFLTENSWMFRALIVRLDTGEELNEKFVSKSSSKEEGLNTLYDKVFQFLKDFKKPPNWMELDVVRCLINRHISYKNEIGDIWNRLDELFESKGITVELLADGVSKIRHLTLSHSLYIQKYISTALESDLLRLDEAQKSFYNIDSEKRAHVLDAMSDIFEYIIAPSKKVVDAHNRHVKRLDNLI